MTREHQIKEAAKQRADQYDHPSKWSDTYYGFIDGAKWADQHPHWIPVEERLPEEENLYIVSNGKETSVAYWVEDAWDSFGDVITHWMPLPVPPRKEE